MTTEEISSTKEFSQIKQIIKENNYYYNPDIDVNAITPETKIKLDLGIDELDFIELIMTLEEEYGIFISEEDGEAMKTVGDCVELVLKLMKDEKKGHLY